MWCWRNDARDCASHGRSGRQAPAAQLAAAIKACLAADAEWIEVDICALRADDFILVHTHNLAVDTTGSGDAAALQPAEVRNLRLLQGGQPSAYPPALLSEAVAALAEAGNRTRLQLDWKDMAPFTTHEPLERLARLIHPLGERVLVSSMADWQLRHLAESAPSVALGFDIHLYIDYDPPGQAPEPGSFPQTTGAFGYRDDHPLASARWGTTADYLAERCGELLGRVPGAGTFYLNHTFLARSLADGFDWIQALHAAGKRLDAWTLDADNPPAAANARLLAKRGCDLLTTNTPLALAEWLQEVRR